jgi:hypothetical protein
VSGSVISNLAMTQEILHPKVLNFHISIALCLFCLQEPDRVWQRD